MIQKILLIDESKNILIRFLKKSRIIIMLFLFIFSSVFGCLQYFWFETISRENKPLKWMDSLYMQIYGSIVFHLHTYKYNII